MAILNSKSGFTLLELLLTMAIFSIIVAISLPMFSSYQSRNSLDIATYSVVQALRRAQSLARSGENDSSWGVHAQTSTITVFLGNNFASRDINFDEKFNIASDITISSTDIIFTKFTGETTVVTSTLTSPIGKVKTININQKGTININ